jgi:hypothetical protein
MVEPKRFWFPAKRYGWGWGFPITWQGWIAFGIFFLLALAGPFAFSPAREASAFFIYMLIISVAFAAVCYAKGEPPSWRWGDRNDGRK